MAGGSLGEGIFIIVISGITSFVIFSKIFEKLNKDNTKLYAPIEKIVNKLKRKNPMEAFFLLYLLF